MLGVVHRAILSVQQLQSVHSMHLDREQECCHCIAGGTAAPWRQDRHFRCLLYCKKGAVVLLPAVSHMPQSQHKLYAYCCRDVTSILQVTFQATVWQCRWGGHRCAAHWRVETAHACALGICFYKVRQTSGHYISRQDLYVSAAMQHAAAALNPSSHALHA
jgi:hypothetical protein